MTGTEVYCPQCGYSTLIFGTDSPGCPECEGIHDDAPEGIVKKLDGSPVLIVRGGPLDHGVGV